MTVTAEFINELIAGSDPFIRSHGGEKGYYEYKLEYAKAMSKNTNMQQFSDVYIGSIERGDSESPFYAKFLTKAFIDSEQKAKAPENLKEWIFKGLDKVGDGASADDAFHLKTRRGVRRTKPNLNRLICICYVELKLRKGIKKAEAIRACNEKFGGTERVIFSFLEDIKIDANISDKTLVFYRDKDISSDYSPN